MIEAVLCDIDGTLVDSNAQHAEAWRLAFAHFGIQVKFEDVLRQIGKGGDKLVPEFVPPQDLSRIEKPLKEYRKELFHREFFDKLKPFPAAREVVEKMHAVGLRVAVASSSNKEDLGRLKDIAGITDLVEKETSSGDAKRVEARARHLPSGPRSFGRAPRMCRCARRRAMGHGSRQESGRRRDRRRERSLERRGTPGRRRYGGVSRRRRTHALFRPLHSRQTIGWQIRRGVALQSLLDPLEFL